MCFSAESSFAVAAALAVVGRSTCSTPEPRLRLLASVPLLFGVQQLAEGFVWTSLGATDGFWGVVHAVAARVFIAFAYPFWPVFVPLSVLAAESRPAARRVLCALLGPGMSLAIGLIALSPLFEIDVHVSAQGHLKYVRGHLESDALRSLYVVVVLGATHLGTLRWLSLFGLVMAVGFVVSSTHYSETFTSVWCFFAAIASATLWFAIPPPRPRPRRSPPTRAATRLDDRSRSAIDVMLSAGLARNPPWRGPGPR